MTTANGYGYGMVNTTGTQSLDGQDESNEHFNLRFPKIVDNLQCPMSLLIIHTY